MASLAAELFPSVRTPRADSIVGAIMESQGRGGRWTPVLFLINLVWLYVVPLLARLPAGWEAATNSLALAFLYCHYQGYYGAASRALYFACATALMGFALIGINTGGLALLIFTAFLVGSVRSPRFTSIWLAGITGIALVEIGWVYGSWTFALGMMAPIVIVGMLAIFNCYAIDNRRRLRDKQSEIQRLAVIAERERIGRDLHDLLGHTLSVVALKSELAGKLVARDAAAAAAEIAEVARVAREALAQVRTAVTGIRAAGLSAEVAAGRALLLARGIDLTSELEPVALAAPVETALALAAREAFTNIERHSRGRNAAVRLRRAPDAITLEIANDGVEQPFAAGNGIRGMRERLAAIGGTLSISAEQGSALLRIVVAAKAAT